MQYRTVPRNGDELSALGFGTMRLPTRLGRVDVDRAVRQIRYTIDNGVNYIDTAYPYHLGESEKIVGLALRDGYRARVRIADKLSPWLVRTRDDMERILSIQLDRLQADCIDYYLLHSLEAQSWRRLDSLGVMEFLESAREEGRIGNIGFSFHDERSVFREIVDAYDWTFCQIQFNILDEEIQAGLEGLRYAASRDIAVMIMEPLRGGMLAADVPGEVRTLYDRSGFSRTPAEWALRWVWNHPEVTVVLSGMNDERHIAENIRAAGASLPNSMTDSELSTMNQVKAAYKRLVRVNCTGCGYCMPCPFGVNIPQCFYFYNRYHMGGSRLVTRGFYILQVVGFENKPGNASLCMDCGRCVEACPQGIAIPDELRKASKDLDGFSTRLMYPFVKAVLRRERME